MDTGGRLLYTIRFEDLATGKLLGDTIADVTSNLAWANDSKTLILFETGPEDPPRRSDLPPSSAEPFIQRHPRLRGADETFSCRVTRTKSDRYLMIAS
jgi:oligopeptidase B